MLEEILPAKGNWCQGQLSSVGQSFVNIADSIKFLLIHLHFIPQFVGSLAYLLTVVVGQNILQFSLRIFSGRE